MAVVDIETGNVYVYRPENSRGERIYLLYDGIHYDLLIYAREGYSLDQRDSNSVKTVFSSDDETVFNSFKLLSNQLKEQRSFINLSTAQFRCLVCHATFSEQSELAPHATSTGHQNFGQA